MAAVRLLEKLKTTATKLSEIDNEIMTIYSQGMVGSFAKGHLVPNYVLEGSGQGFFSAFLQARSQKKLKGHFENAKALCLCSERWQ